MRINKNIPYIAIFGALSIIMSAIRVSFPLGNPNLGSTPVSISATILNAYSAFIIGIIKGIGVSLWTGQVLLEMSAGIGDGIMGAFTSFLSKRLGPIIAVIIGQFSRYIFTSGMIALVLGITSVISPEISYPLVGKFLPKNTSLNLINVISLIWIAMIPAITTSIIVNTIISTIVVITLVKSKIIKQLI
jgi:predicted membrane protein